MRDFVAEFPTVMWGETRATFVTLGGALPMGTTAAALVFAQEAGQFALADIAGRGWCIPGGRLEAGETEEQAARREVGEEIGATLGPLRLIGHCVLFDTIPGPSGLQSDPSAEPPARLIAMYLADVQTRAAIPTGSESRGVRLVPYEAISTCYFLWDELMEAMFRYAQRMKDEG